MYGAGLVLVWLSGCATECPAGSSMGSDGLCRLDDTVGDSSETDGETTPDTDIDTDTDSDTEPVVTEVAVLGGGSHSLDGLVVTEIAGPGDDLTMPTDLEFSPDSPDQLWVTDGADDEMVILFDAGTSQQQSVSYSGDQAHHWLAHPSALAFGAPGYLATSHHDLGSQVGNHPSMEMGPSLWPSDVSDFDGGQPSHLDMVHDSPLSQGIAWDYDNVYWVHDGYNRAITRYDFAEPHEPGGTYHDDAVLYRYASGEVGYVGEIPSHLALDRDSRLLYFADTELSRIAVLNTSSGTDGGCVLPEDGGTPTNPGNEAPPHGDDLLDKHYVDNAEYYALVEGDPLVSPSGIELHDGLLFVTDNATSKVLAFSLDGELVDWLQTDVAEGGLMGMTFDGDGRLYLVDAVGGRVLRISVD